MHNGSSATYLVSRERALPHLRSIRDRSWPHIDTSMRALRIPSLQKTTLRSAIQDSAPSSLEDSDVDCCAICHQNAGRYTCPQCSIPYCSVQCYRTHGKSSDCTESFYKDRVSKVLQLEIKDNVDDVTSILQRHDQKQSRGVSPAVATQGVVSLPNKVELSHDELAQLFSILEQHGDDELEMSRVLSQPSMRRLRRAVDQVRSDLTSGRGDGSLHEWFIEPWYPWWRAELTSIPCRAEVDDDEDIPEQTKTLDERILAAPQFRKLYRQSAQHGEAPLLQYNLVDILCSAVHVLWLYHGARNATKELPLESYRAFVNGSAVLSMDARFVELPEVLVSCKHRFASPLDNDGDTVSAWTALLRDAALICQNYRFVARALFDMCDIIKAAVATVKKQEDSDDVEMRSSMRKIGKKLQFYLSWSLCNKAKVSCLADDIAEWLARAKLQTV
jgi:HIT zinc finger